MALCWRRAAGALHEPLGLGPLLLTGGAAVLIAAAFRAWLGPLIWRSAAGDRRALHLARSVALVLMAFAISLPGTSPLGLVVLWGLVAVEELWAWFGTPEKSGLIPGRFQRWLAGNQLTRRTKPSDAAAWPPEMTPQIPRAESSRPTTGSNSRVWQQVTRTRTADGQDAAHAWLRVAFAPGQRTETAHVAFCPSFAATPQLMVRQTGGPPARIKEGPVFPYGVRLEVKLFADLREPASVTVEFTATDASP